MQVHTRNVRAGVTRMTPLYSELCQCAIVEGMMDGPFTLNRPHMTLSGAVTITVLVKMMWSNAPTHTTFINIDCVCYMT